MLDVSSDHDFQIEMTRLAEMLDTLCELVGRAGLPLTAHLIGAAAESVRDGNGHQAVGDFDESMSGDHGW